MNGFRVGDRWVGDESPCFIVAEIGINHNGSREDLLRLVEAAACAGADAVKLQYFSAEKLVSPRLMPEAYEFFKTVEISKEDAELAFRLARGKGLIPFASVFDEDGLEAMLDLEMPLIKIASGDLTTLPFLVYSAMPGIPILLSTGAASLEEIDEAVETIGVSGEAPVCLMQCTSLYPSNLDEINLSLIPYYRERYDLVAGFSDHTLGIEAAPLAVAAGARVYEKHFTLNSADPRPDHSLSLDPRAFKSMVESIRRTEKILGNRQKPLAKEAETRVSGRKSLTAAVDLPTGHVLRMEDITIRRPAVGIPPSEIDRVLGKELSSEVKAGEAITIELLKF